MRILIRLMFPKRRYVDCQSERELVFKYRVAECAIFQNVISKCTFSLDSEWILHRIFLNSFLRRNLTVNITN